MASLVFDLDGTLADSKESILLSFQHGLQKIGFSNVRFDEIFILQNDLETSFKKICSESDLNFDEELCRQFIDVFREHQSSEAEDVLLLYPEVEATLDSLRAHFKLGVATTKHSEQARRVLKRLKVDHYFQHIQGTDPGMRYKPYPDILEHTLTALNLVGSRAAYVGDSVHDMLAARSMGMCEIGAGYGFAGPSLLKEHGPHHLLTCISELVNLRPQLSLRFN